MGIRVHLAERRRQDVQLLAVVVQLAVGDDWLVVVEGGEHKNCERVLQILRNQGDVMKKRPYLLRNPPRLRVGRRSLSVTK